MTNVDFDNKPFVAPKEAKTFGTVDTSVDFLEALGADQALKRTLFALQRGPIRFCRNNVIVAEGDVTDYIFFVIKGLSAVARRSKMVPAASSHFICREMSLVGPI